MHMSTGIYRRWPQDWCGLCAYGKCKDFGVCMCGVCLYVHEFMGYTGDGRKIGVGCVLVENVSSFSVCVCVVYVCVHIDYTGNGHKTGMCACGKCKYFGCVCVCGVCLCVHVFIDYT